MQKIPHTIVALASAVTATALVFTLANPINAATNRPESTVTNTTNGRAVPITTVAEFNKEFTSKINEGIANNAANNAKGKKAYWALNTKLKKGWVSTKLLNYPEAKPLSVLELKELRDQISTGLNSASANGVSLSVIASGSIGNDFWVGNVERSSVVKGTDKPSAK